MKLPRNCSGLERANKLAEFGYEVSRQTGSHIAIPQHDSLKVGMFSAVLNNVAKHFLISRDDLIKQLF